MFELWLQCMRQVTMSKRSRSTQVVPFGGDILSADDAEDEKDLEETSIQEPVEPKVEEIVEEPKKDDEENDDDEEDEEPIYNEPFVELDEDEEDENSPKNRPYKDVPNAVFDIRHLRAGRIIQDSRDKAHPGMVLTEDIHQISHPCGCTLRYRRVLIPEKDVMVHAECTRTHRVYGNREDEEIFGVLGDRNPHKQDSYKKQMLENIDKLENELLPLIKDVRDKSRLKQHLEELKKS